MIDNTANIEEQRILQREERILQSKKRRAEHEKHKENAVKIMLAMLN
jgi:hypothetical protein